MFVYLFSSYDAIFTAYRRKLNACNPLTSCVGDLTERELHVFCLICYMAGNYVMGALKNIEAWPE